MTIKYSHYFSLLMSVLVLSLAGLAENRNDVILYDETHMLHQGFMGSFDFQSYEQSPLYSLFYYIISLFQPDPLSAYFLNHSILLFSLGMLMCFCTLRWLKSYALAVFVSILFLILHNDVWPRVTYLASVFLLILLFFLSFDFIKARFYLILQASVVLAYFIVFLRPEFYISFYIFLFLYLFYFCKGLFYLRPFKVSDLFCHSALFFLILLALAFSFPIPVPDSEGRAFVAFGQHYSLNVHKMYGLLTDPWLSWVSIIQKDFGVNTHGVFSAFLNSPLKFSRHLLLNLKSVFSQGGTFLFLFVYLISLFLPKKQKQRSEWRCLHFVLSVFLLPVIISILLVYPREHYLLMLNVLLFSLVIVNIAYAKKPFKFSLDVHISIVLLCAFFAFSFFLQFKEKSKYTYDAVVFMRELEREVAFSRVLEVDGGWCVYLDTCSEVYTELNKELSWYLGNIDTVVVSLRFLNNVKGRALAPLIKYPDKYGYYIVDVGPGIYLLKRSAL